MEDIGITKPLAYFQDDQKLGTRPGSPRQKSNALPTNPPLSMLRSIMRISSFHFEVGHSQIVMVLSAPPMGRISHVVGRSSFSLHYIVSEFENNQNSRANYFT